MKYLVTLFFTTVISFISALNLNAQTSIDEGSMIIDVYYSWPNLVAEGVRSEDFISFGSDPNKNEIDLFYIGATGAKVEYLLSEDISFGIELNYSSTIASYSKPLVSSEGAAGKYTQKESLTRFRVMPRFSYHAIRSEKVDFYVSLAAGYMFAEKEFSEEIIAPENGPLTISSTNLINNTFPVPVSIRLATGLRYFFLDALGAHFEIGFGGGGIIAAGLTYEIFNTAEESD